jgi:hypothetical protein
MALADERSLLWRNNVRASYLSFAIETTGWIE